MEFCGNGIVDVNEGCDDGNSVSGDGCSANCHLEYCGNGVVDQGESCDDGNNASGDGCSDCYSEYCGNGVVDPGENCDDGNNVSGDGCRADCHLEYCGNGVVDPGENCDDGNNVSGDSCSANCHLEHCGNGVVDPGENCDDGNITSGDNCSANCHLEYCGNGVVDSGENCDDGNNVSGDGCSANCHLEYCGNGVLDQGEECDTAGESLFCDLDCTVTWCGDGAVNTAAGEQCDTAGESASCDVDCTASWCGDGVVNGAAGEECDDGNFAAGDGCDSACERTSALENRLVAGGAHTCALLEAGEVRCWGDGSYGQLGYGNTNNIGDNEAPATAGDVEVGSAALQLAAGWQHTCALLETGAVRCWGNGSYGRLGYGNSFNIGDNEAPASAGNVDVGGAVVQLAAGSSHTCALLDTGAVRCWGTNSNGQLGYGSLNNIGDNETPATVGDVDVGGVVVQLAAGDWHTCVLLETGAVRCWGRGSHGQLGYGNTSNLGDNETPAAAGDVNVGGVAVQLTAGGGHTCALMETGAVRCWGSGLYGQLGYGNASNIGDDETPAAAGDVDVGSIAVQVAAGGQHTCVLMEADAVRCWGYGGAGRLGYGNTEIVGNDESPASVGDVPYR